MKRMVCVVALFLSGGPDRCGTNEFAADQGYGKHGWSLRLSEKLAERHRSN